MRKTVFKMAGIKARWNEWLITPSIETLARFLVIDATNRT
jgi:hypothetical protein